MFARLKRIASEVRRRKVHRTAAAYIVVAIMVLEGADLTLPSLAVPAWTYNLLVFLVVALFPIAVTLSWIFDITEHGLLRTDSVPEPAPKRVAVAKQETDELEAIDSLAILPFSPLSDDPDDAYLSEGIAESIINRVSRLSGIRVVPRASAFRYGGTDPDLDEVSKSLNVRAIMTGRVRHRGPHLLIQAELVDVVRQAQLWGENYTRPWEDVFDIQEEMATEIFRALKLTLSEEDERRLARRDTNHATAYQEYLKGRHEWNKRTAEGFKGATRRFREAIGIDPEYALAYAGLADTYNVMGYYGIQAPKDSYPPAKVAAERALELDPSLAEARASLGYATLFYDRQWEEAAEHFKGAIEQNPRYASAHQWYAWYFLVKGDFDETLKHLEVAQGLDPLSLIINDHLAYAYLLNGSVDEARGQIRKTQGLSPDYPLALWRLGDYRLTRGDLENSAEAYERAAELTDGLLCSGYLGMVKALMDDVAGAQAILDRFVEESTTRYISPLDRALVYAGLGDLTETFKWLETAAEERVSDMVRLRLLPWPEAVTSDSRFDDLVGRLGLPSGEEKSRFA